jgi:hypothetical protein
VTQYDHPGFETDSKDYRGYKDKLPTINVESTLQVCKHSYLIEAFNDVNHTERFNQTSKVEVVKQKTSFGYVFHLSVNQPASTTVFFKALSGNNIAVTKFVFNVCDVIAS